MEYGMFIFLGGCIPKLYTIPILASRQMYNQTFGRAEGSIKVVGNAAACSSASWHRGRPRRKKPRQICRDWGDVKLCWIRRQPVARPKLFSNSHSVNTTNFNGDAAALPFHRLETI